MTTPRPLRDVKQSAVARLRIEHNPRMPLSIKQSHSS
jgi:hypothetical protein